MRKKITIFIAFTGCFFCLPLLGWGADWQELHNLADRKSIEEAREDSVKEPGSADRLYVLGLVYLTFYRNGEAQEVFSQLAARGEKPLETSWAQAELLRRSHKLPESEKALGEVIKSSPDFLPALLSLAYIKYTVKDFQGSLDIASRVFNHPRIALDKANYSRACLIIAGSKGMLAYFHGPFSKVIHGTQVKPYLSKAQKLEPDWPDVNYGFGCYYLLIPSFMGKDLRIAGDYLEKAISRSPLFADAYARLAQVYKARGEDRKYSQLLDKALEIDPGNELTLDIKSGKCGFVCP